MSMEKNDVVAGCFLSVNILYARCNILYMTTIWKNKIFSGDTQTSTPNSSPNNLYNDYNYKNIPSLSEETILNMPPFIHPHKPENNVRETASQEPFDMLDTSALDKDDRKQPISISDNEITLGITSDKLTQAASQAATQAAETSTNIGRQTINYTEMYVNDVRNILYQILTYYNELASKRFNIDRAYRLIGASVAVPTQLFYRTILYFSQMSTSFVNSISGPKAIDMRSNEYNNLLDTVNKMVINMANISIASWIAYNWWYIFAYYHGYVDPSKIMDIEGVKVLTESHLMFLSTVNYLLMGIKEDKAYEQIVSILWSYRAVVFFCLLVAIKYIINNYKQQIEQGFFDAISRKSNFISSIGVLFFFYSFIKMDIFNIYRMYQRVSLAGTIITVFLVIFKLLINLTLLPLGYLLVYAYLVFLSFFGLIAFSGGGFLNELSKIEIDLENSVPKPENREETLFEKLKRVFLNKFIKIAFMVLTLWAASNNLSLIRNLKQKNATYSIFLMITFVVLLLCVSFFIYLITDELFGKIFKGAGLFEMLYNFIFKTNKKTGGEPRVPTQAPTPTPIPATDNSVPLSTTNDTNNNIPQQNP